MASSVISLIWYVYLIGTQGGTWWRAISSSNSKTRTRATHLIREPLVHKANPLVLSNYIFACRNCRFRLHTLTFCVPSQCISRYLLTSIIFPKFAPTKWTWDACCFFFIFLIEVWVLLNNKICLFYHFPHHLSEQ